MKHFWNETVKTVSFGKSGQNFKNSQKIHQDHPRLFLWRKYMAYISVHSAKPLNTQVLNFWTKQNKENGTVETVSSEMRQFKLLISSKMRHFKLSHIPLRIRTITKKESSWSQIKYLLKKQKKCACHWINRILEHYLLSDGGRHSALPHRIQLDWTPDLDTHKNNVSTNQEGCDRPETIDKKLSTKRIQRCRAYVYISKGGNIIQTK